MRIGPHGVRPGPPGDELQELVDGRVAHLIDVPIAIGTGDASE
jgi:hypothetical protein